MKASLCLALIQHDFHSLQARPRSKKSKAASELDSLPARTMLAAIAQRSAITDRIAQRSLTCEPISEHKEQIGHAGPAPGTPRVRVGPDRPTRIGSRARLPGRRAVVEARLVSVTARFSDGSYQ